MGVVKIAKFIVCTFNVFLLVNRVSHMHMCVDNCVCVNEFR